jgi:DNA-binding NarL/FixJ family response regulator
VTGDSIRILLVDDHPVYRDGLAKLLSAFDDITVVAVAGTGREAVERTDELGPDVVVMDLRMPDLDGVEATRQIVNRHPTLAVVVLTMFDDDELLLAAIRAGARGYVLKDADDTEIARVIRGIARGEAIFGPGTAERLLDTLRQIPPPPSAERDLPGLTDRERDVLDGIARGWTNHEIAAHLYLSERTVRNYVSAIFSKLQVATRGQAIVIAREAGLGSSESPERANLDP